uniref:Uncharacterized protein n=1 Tax=Parascaris equorum TaxID=6256 RepID=A0A914RQE0_PAREQ
MVHRHVRFDYPQRKSEIGKVERLDGSVDCKVDDDIKVEEDASFIFTICRSRWLVTNVNEAALSNREKQLRAEFDVYKEEMATKQDELSAENKKLMSTMADLEVKNREMSRALDEAKSKLQQKETVEDEQLQIVSNDLENATHRAVEQLDGYRFIVESLFEPLKGP